MKRLLFIIFTIHCSLAILAQPGWVKKATKSVFTLKTFDANGSLIGSSNGFFVGDNGEAMSSFSPFKGASRAVVIDAAGKEYPVSVIMGANDMYDVAKFRVAAQKTQPLTVSAGIQAVGSTTWILPFRETKTVKSGPVRKAETFLNNYAYYTIAIQAGENEVSCPLLNEAGEVIGLIQQPAQLNDSLSYAVSASFIDSLKITGMSINDPTLQLTQIKKDVPDDLQNAILMLYMAGSSTDSATYAGLIHDVIQKYPDAPDGYIYRAQFAAGSSDFKAADQDIQQAIKVAKEKDDAHFNYARMIYNKEIYQSNVPYESWSLDKALSEIREAQSINPQPIYQQMEANILFAQKNYNEAYELFLQLTKSQMTSAEIWYSAARCKQMQKDTTAYLALLDSTMNTFSKPYLKEAAPYLWSRANAKLDAKKYRDAVNDLNEYEQLMQAQVNDKFYYIRHQAEVEGRLYQQALNDITKAIQMNPKEAFYYSEKASLQIRVGQYQEALQTADECIAVDPETSNGYLFKGLAQCLLGNKNEGTQNLQKAKELGDPQADRLIEKYAK
jgi:Flp pilus assembly protein TadD